MDLDECKRLWGRNTRAYAKRQLTWFNADKAVSWFRPGEDEAMFGAVREFLDG